MTFPANIDHLHAILDWIKKQLSPLPLTPKTIRNIELAVEEAVVNIITHGYKNKSGEILFHVHHFPDRHIEIEIVDTAPPFNPLDNNVKKDPAQIGGLGIHMMKQCVDSIDYRRDAKRNILILKKKY